MLSFVAPALLIGRTRFHATPNPPKGLHVILLHPCTPLELALSYGRFLPLYAERHLREECCTPELKIETSSHSPVRSA